MGNLLSHIVAILVGMFVGYLFKPLIDTVITKLNKKNP